MSIRTVWEHNGESTLLYAVDHPGAYARGACFEEAAKKLPEELRAYCRWCGKTVPEDMTVFVVQEKASELHIADADSDVLFDAEKAPLTGEAYSALKALALKSAADLETLFRSVPDREQSVLLPRKTFYGSVPRTAAEMYLHTKNVNAYYFGEIGVEADNEGDILSCRKRGFAALEAEKDHLNLPPREGSYGEWWSLRKVLRRFIWHDRIHARAMLRMAKKTFPGADIKDPFCF